MANPRSSDVLIALSLDCRLTTAHLAALSPEQIKALVEAAGTIASLTSIAEQSDTMRALADRMERRAADGGDNPADCNAMAEFADELRRIAEGGDRG